MIDIDLNESVLHFAVNKWAIPKEGEGALNDAIKLLNDYPAMKITVTGYTDSTGTAAWNATLSKRRAESVAKYFTTHGIDAARIANVEGKGPADPIADNKTKEGKAQNRRVHVKAEEVLRVPAK
jgi:OmpA-OmpF porin, OOP family